MFSLVIPCYNPEKTIFRLFDSLTKQCISNNELEIILVDDKSDSLEYRNKLSKYGFNLIFTETGKDPEQIVHCPGNARREGLNHVSGKWVCFCDQDDYFEGCAFLKVKKFIEQNEKNRKIYTISTIMRSYNEETDECYEEYPNSHPWLHGKWYSMDNLIIPFNINFKKNLMTHEDLYFNSSVLAALCKLHADWDHLDAYTYRWVDTPDSMTRRINAGRGYLYENFHDYIVGSGEPFWEYAKETKNIMFINQIIMTLLHCYFYYEAAVYFNGPANYKDILEMIKNYLNDIMNDFDFSLKYIINFVYSDPFKYKIVLADCEAHTGQFIAISSFKDFVIKISK